ncbi:hypothetical protein, partial [Aliikangiella coralliicola]|uniref:hypothetical protein n=1 Tax=Aliikangiella coralliicola TaxID=2592383 RepID=UPI00143D0F80
WSDAMKVGYFLDEGYWGYFVRQVDEICNSPDEFHPLQVQVAKEVQKVFDDPEIPERAKLDIEKSRAGEYAD